MSSKLQRAFIWGTFVALVLVWGVTAGTESLVAQKGKPSKAPERQYEVSYYETDSNGNLLNIRPDGEGLFGGLPCFFWSPCYLDGVNGFTISDDGGGWKQVHSFDRGITDGNDGNTFHYRHFVTDIEYHAQQKCGDLIDPGIAPNNSLGGYYNGETEQPIRLTLWIDDWPEEGESEILTSGNAVIPGMAPVVDVDGAIFFDYDNDFEDEALLDAVSPFWTLEFDPKMFPGSEPIVVKRVGDGFLVSSTKAELRVRQLNTKNPDAPGKTVKCDIVDAAFEFFATPLTP